MLGNVGYIALVGRISGCPEPPKAEGAGWPIAEDNSVNQKVAIGQLRRSGYCAEAAPNGVAVLEALSRNYYEIILMDWQMPKVDGYEATRRIRARSGNFPQPYIIAMTAHAMQGDSEKCFRLAWTTTLASQYSWRRWRPR